MKIKKEIYVEHPKPGHCVFVNNNYVRNTGLERIETMSLMCEGRDDEPLDSKVRYSKDNGRTWADWQKAPEIMAYHEKYSVYGIRPEDSENLPRGGFLEDPATGFYVSSELRQTVLRMREDRYKKGPVTGFHNHCFWRISRDKGKTWSKAQLLRYEDGADYDPGNPLDPAFLKNNSAYSGGFISHSNGSFIFCATSVNIPKDAPHTDPEGTHGNWWSPSGARDIGSALFIGQWDAKEDTCRWQRSNCVWVPMSVSCRGLCEGYPVELGDGRILVVWRGSDTPETPGRKWFSISKDGGRTLSEVKELTYDDGTRFYSPSSLHGFVRHSATGKVFWFANITPKPPQGNSPRYPLIMAEIDEKIPAVKRNTVTIIADRGRDDSEEIQWSNFSLLENRETHDIELYMCPIGSKATYKENAAKFWEADCYKFTIQID